MTPSHGKDALRAARWKLKQVTLEPAAGVQWARRSASFDIEAAYAQCGPMVIRRCRQLLRNEHDALDAAHDVFVQLLVRRETLEERGSSSLLYRVATNVCLNRLRSRARRPEDTESAQLARILESTAVDDERERLPARSLLGRLLGRELPSTAMIAVLHFHDG
jgi:RNA polymerase sigma-70 factor (ECF subfamily)